MNNIDRMIAAEQEMTVRNYHECDHTDGAGRERYAFVHIYKSYFCPDCGAEKPQTPQPEVAIDYPKNFQI